MIGEIAIAIALFGVIAVIGLALQPSSDDLAVEPTELNDQGIVCTSSPDGVLVPCDPAGLAKGMGMDLDHYAMARMIASEAGGQPFIAQVGVAWTVRNHAAKKGRPIWKIITRATLKQDGEVLDGAGDGYFGKQGDPDGGYRYCGSSKDTNADIQAIAQSVCRGEIDDPTEGALNFDTPKGYSDPAKAQEFADNRASEGKIAFALPGVPLNTFRFWRPA